MIKIIGNEILFCKICDSFYSEKNKPYILNCGNTVCNYCVKKYTHVDINSSDHSCYFNLDHHHMFEEVPVNYTLLNIIQNFKSNFMKKENIKEDHIESYFKIRSSKKAEKTEKIDSLQKINQTESEIKVETEEYIFKGTNLPGKIQKGEVFDKVFKSIYIGVFIGDLKSGNGEIHYSNGIIYFGQWNNWSKTGKGEIIYPNGNTYIGDFYNDLFNGYGEFYNAECKKRTIGTWKDGKEDGEIMIYSSNCIKPIRIICKNGETVTILEL